MIDIHIFPFIHKGKVKTVIIQMFLCVILYSFVESTCERRQRTVCLYFINCLFVFLFFFTHTHNKMYSAEYFSFEFVHLVSIKL